MTKTAKLFMTGRSQAVRLPKAFRLPGEEVFIRRDEASGDVILSPRPNDWDGLFELYERDGGVATDFMGPEDRVQGAQERDPFAG